jgi:hypothetical protein
MSQRLTPAEAASRARRALSGSPLPRFQRRPGWAVGRYEEYRLIKVVGLPSRASLPKLEATKIKVNESSDDPG